MAQTDGHNERDTVVVILEEEETAPVPVSGRAEQFASAAATLSLRGPSRLPLAEPRSGRVVDFVLVPGRLGIPVARGPEGGPDRVA